MKLAGPPCAARLSPSRRSPRSATIRRAGGAGHAGHRRRRDRALHGALQPADGAAGRSRARRPPFAVECPVAGEGRWVDQQTWVYEFASPLPGGTTCNFTLVDDLRSVAGYAVDGAARASPSMPAGRSRARCCLPAYGERDRGGPGVPGRREHARRPPRRSAPDAYCAVDGLGEKIPVDVLGADVAAEAASASWQGQLERPQLPGECRAARRPARDRRTTARSAGRGHRAQMPPPAAAGARHGAGVGRGDRRRGRQDRRRRPAVRLYRAQAVHRAVRMLRGSTRRPAAARSRRRMSASPRRSPLATAKAIRIETADGKSIDARTTRSFEKSATTDVGDVTFVGLPDATTAKADPARRASRTKAAARCRTPSASRSTCGSTQRRRW